MDSENPFAVGVHDEPAKPAVRSLTCGEWIGTLIGASIAAFVTFFATCAGLAAVVEAFASWFVDGANEVFLLLCLFIIPATTAAIVALAVIRAARK